MDYHRLCDIKYNNTTLAVTDWENTEYTGFNNTRKG